MATIKFTRHLERHLSVPPLEAEGGTVQEVLERAFVEQPKLRGYVSLHRRRRELGVDLPPIYQVCFAA